MLKNTELIKQKEYLGLINSYFDIVQKRIDIYGLMLFGSAARGEAKPYKSYESDIDLLVIIKDLSVDLQDRLLKKIYIEAGTKSRVQAIWMTPEELGEHIEAKAGYILDAFEEGIILYDPKFFIEDKKQELIQELNKKGVIKLKWGYSWNIKAGEVVEL